MIFVTSLYLSLVALSPAQLLLPSIAAVAGDLVEAVFLDAALDSSAPYVVDGDLVEI